MREPTVPLAATWLVERASNGFYTVGVMLPFLLFSAFTGVFSLFALICLVPLVMGIGMIASDDALHRPSLWWKRGLSQLLNGAVNGLFFALIMVWFTSCTNGLFLSPYRMM